MSAAMKPTPAFLTLPVTEELPRKLSLELSSGGYFYAYARAPNGCSIAHVCEPFQEVKLYSAWIPPALIVSGAHFGLTESEAAEVERTFGPLGLRVDRERP